MSIWGGFGHSKQTCVGVNVEGVTGHVGDTYPDIN